MALVLRGGPRGGPHARPAGRGRGLPGLGVVAPRRGIDGAREFFALLDTFVVHEFRVLDLLASPTQVVAQIVIELTYPSGGRVRDEELHLWRFDDDHKIAALRHYVDTAKHIAAWNGEDTTRRGS
ncbi:MAG TPA: hypothetical protein VMK84_01050 [Streptosporangiaceae bacterium]|nr:hypothetical protein [Streptosporangiaceae bacterium]